MINNKKIPHVFQFYQMIYQQKVATLRHKVIYTVIQLYLHQHFSF